jgi:5'-methylthioadenosine phosphorylase
MLGILGGTGIGEALGTLGKGEAYRVDTPFGPPAEPITVVEVDGVTVALLARHGEGHRYPPGRVPYRANVFALKSLGVTHLLATAAVGSLREEIRPRDLVVPDQLIDRTVNRETTFFEELAVHVEFAQPFCTSLRRVLLEVPGPRAVRDGGTFVCMEGPQFSTRAESELHRSWGAELIGMTLLPEAKLAREAELCYAAIALVTDHDCWRPPRAELDRQALLEEILGHLGAATEAALGLLRAAIPAVARLPAPGCSCQRPHPRGVDRAGAHPRGDPASDWDCSCSVLTSPTATRAAGPRPGPASRRGPRARCRR